MTTKDKRSPALTDQDFPPFGKHSTHGSDPLPLQDVPASYLAWLWRDGLHEHSRNLDLTRTLQLGELHKVELANYIHNSRDAIAQEIGETL